MVKAVILAGGLGKRLRPLTDTRPKPLIELSGVPILGWQIRWLKRAGVGDLTLCAGYMKESIVRYLGNGESFGITASYTFEDEPLGTGGALRNAHRFFSQAQDEPFLVINGDVLTNLDPGPLFGAIRDRVVCAMALTPLRSPFGIVEMVQDGTVTGFKEKPLLKQYWINAGVYCFAPSIIDYLPERGDLEIETFPRLATEGRVRGMKYENVSWRSIDSHKDLDEAEKEIEALMGSPSPFNQLG